MPDLKAAAERFKKLFEKKSLASMRNGRTSKATELANESWNYFLAAQVLEALAWQGERQATVEPYWNNDGWRCVVGDRISRADTPLGAVLAAMEGEKDGK